jgi:hypothetical protein
MVFQKKALTLISICFFSFSAISQRQNNYTAEANAIIGTAQTPFWMRANKFGKVPIKGETLSIFGGVNSDYEETGKAIKWGYGANLGVFVGLQNRVIIQQAYAKAKWKAIELYLGRREEIQGLVDTTLTSGSYIWSGNALPMPKIDISIQNYTPLGRSGIFSVKGNYAHGWFDANRNDAKGVLLHQKSFYARLGKPNWKVKFYGGFNHQVQWGGRAKYTDKSLGITEGGDLGSTLNDYLYIISGRTSINTDTSKVANENDKNNRIGNHLGGMDLAIEINLKKGKLLIYRQSIFDDGSLYYLNNITDGLQGISLNYNFEIGSKLLINKITFEYFNTLSQGGNFNDNNPQAPSIRGNDNYFNNGVIRNGWAYNQTTIGTPFILAKTEFPQQKVDPINNNFLTNNRIQAYYLALSGSYSNIYNFIGKISFSNNWGSNGLIFQPLQQNSFLVSVSKNYSNLFNLGDASIHASLAGDFGYLLSTNIAASIGVKYNFNLNHPTHKHFN